MLLDALWTEVFAACKVGTKVCDGLFFVEMARNIVLEIGFHVVNVESFGHLLSHSD